LQFFKEEKGFEPKKGRQDLDTRGDIKADYAAYAWERK